VWLENGLRQYERLYAHQKLSDADTNDALAAASYVCAVVDLEKYLVQRADMLVAALKSDNKQERAKTFNGMARAAPILIPLMSTAFVIERPSCERTFVIVLHYLHENPDMLPKDAGTIIDRALLDAYSKTDEQALPNHPRAQGKR